MCYLHAIMISLRLESLQHMKLGKPPSLSSAKDLATRKAALRSSNEWYNIINLVTTRVPFCFLTAFGSSQVFGGGFGSLWLPNPPPKT